jgi:hypothetical protein
MNPMMECGHSANAKDADGNPCCAICIGMIDGADRVMKSAPDLSNRKARCMYYDSIPRGRSHSSNFGCERGKICNCEVVSSTALPFFSHTPDMKYDKFYCGCWGWD